MCVVVVVVGFVGVVGVDVCSELVFVDCVVGVGLGCDVVGV